MTTNEISTLSDDALDTVVGGTLDPSIVDALTLALSFS
jgi:hypothetical protein